MSTNKSNNEVEMPMLTIVDSEPVDAVVTDLTIVNQGGNIDTESEIAMTAVSDAAKTCEPAVSDAAKTCEPAVSDASKTCEPAVSDAVKTCERGAAYICVGVPADEANLTEEVSSLINVIKTTECFFYIDKEPEARYNAKEKYVAEKSELEVKTEPEQAISKQPSAEEGSIAEVKATDSSLRMKMTDSISVVEETKLEVKTEPKQANSEQPSIEVSSVAEVKATDSSLKMKITDNISVVTIPTSSESDITPPVTCCNWFKPQRIMSKLRGKRDKSLKSNIPSLTSAVSDPSDAEPEVQLEDGGKYYEDVFIGFISSDSKDGSLERIDYASLAEEKIIPTYLGCHPCYDVMPTSGKVIILSVELLVKNAFSALVTNDIKAAPLWDASFFDFVGMLTISDFINVLRHYYYSNPEDIKDIENQSISTWRRITEVKKSFVKVNSTESLVQATKLLIQENVHRLPVFDEKRQSVLFVLTRKRLLHFLSTSLFDNFEKTNIKTPSFFRKTIGELKVGTYEDIATVNMNTKVIDALDLFVKRNVSSLPVVDKNNVLLDIFEKFDVFQLAKEQTYHNLDMEINEAISKVDVRETAWICTMNETFGTVINRFVNNKVHRIVVTDDKRAVVGMISLSDVLKYLVIDPLENSTLTSATETIDEASEGAVGGSAASSSLESSHKAASLDEEDSSAVSEAVSSLKIEVSQVE